jgi:hypothetical protein
MSVINGILLIYHHPVTRNASTIMEHVNAFKRHSQFKVWNVNTSLGFPRALNNLQFTVIVLHYSLFGLPINLDKKFLNYLQRNQRSYKIAFLQDEHRYWPERSGFINYYRIDCVYTLVEPAYFEETYLKHTRVLKLLYNLPGYVSSEMVATAKQYAKIDDKRTVDVGYRGRRLPYYMGRGSQEKHLVGVEFKKRALALGLRVDIATDEESRIYGKAWPRFLGDCKAVLGVEAGVSVFDIDNVVRPEYEKICKGHPDASYPDCSFEEFHDAVLAPHEERIFYRTISPRHFEAAAFRNCQILFEGKYSGIMKPMVHYIPLKKDFSNFDDVVRRFRDRNFRRELVESAYRDLIKSGVYSYERFIGTFDAELMASGLSPAIAEDDFDRVTASLNRGSLQRYLRVQVGRAMAPLAKHRHQPFLGRDLLKPVFKPLFRWLGI